MVLAPRVPRGALKWFFFADFFTRTTYFAEREGLLVVFLTTEFNHRGHERNDVRGNRDTIFKLIFTSFPKTL